MKNLGASAMRNPSIARRIGNEKTLGHQTEGFRFSLAER
jgi:hypothetical protein